MKEEPEDIFDPARLAPVLIRSLCALKHDEVPDVATAITELLGHAAPEVRAEALSALLVTGRLAAHRHCAVRSLSRDADEGVRARAAYGIAATTSEASRREDLALLVRVLRNAHESPEVQRAAYEGLLLMFHRPEFPDSLEEFDATRDVDWDWIGEMELLHGG
jgi:HEAT repeat protein